MGWDDISAQGARVPQRTSVQPNLLLHLGNGLYAANSGPCRRERLVAANGLLCKANLGLRQILGTERSLFAARHDLDEAPGNLFVKVVDVSGRMLERLRHEPVTTEGSPTAESSG